MSELLTWGEIKARFAAECVGIEAPKLDLLLASTKPIASARIRIRRGYTEGLMLAKLRNIVLWQYPESTSVDALVRHRRWAIRIVYGWTGAAVLMMSSMAEFLLSKPGWLATLSMIVVLASCGVALLLSVPAVLALVWAKDIDRALEARHHEVSTAEPLTRRVGVAAMKMCFWAIVVVVITNILLKA